MDTHNLADLVPALSAASNRVAEIQTLCLLVAASIAVALAAGAAFYRRWSKGKFEAFSDQEWAPPSIMEEGMSVVLESPSATGLQAAPSLLRAVQTRWLALSSPNGRDWPVGSPVCVVVHGPSALYRFHAEIVDRRDVDGIATIFVRKPPRVEKLQRRDHFRVAVHLPTAVNVLGEGDSPALRGDIDNLSGGGFRIALPAPIAAGSLVRVRLPVVTLLGYSFEARVIRCAEARDFGPMRYRASCEFIRLPEETRNLIVSFCFDVQRAARGGNPPGR